MDTVTPMHLLARAHSEEHRSLIEACYKSFAHYTCAGCIDYGQCPMRHRDSAMLVKLHKLLSQLGK